MLIDAHAHLDRYQPTGAQSLDAALAQISRYGIFTVSNSMDLPSYERNLSIAERSRYVLPIFGVHPWNAPGYEGCLDSLAPATEQSPMLGEIGLDFHFVDDTSCYPSQRKVLEHFLRAASEQGKIVNLHTKGAEKEIVRLLDEYDIRQAIVHWYSGPMDVFRKLAARGVYFTVGIEVCYSEHIQAIAREVPTDQLLTETDNPGGPRSYTGALGMPSLIRDVVEALARLRGTSTKSITQTVETNFRALVRSSPELADCYARIRSSCAPSDRGPGR